MAATVAADEQLLLETATRFAADRFTIDGVRAVRDGDRAEASARIRDDWAALGALGWTGLVIPEDRGGQGATWRALGVVLDQLGQRLAVTPMAESVVAAHLLLADAASSYPDLLVGIASGEVCVVLADAETASGGPTPLQTSATRRGVDFVLRGAKEHVVFGPVADAYLVTATVDEPAGPTSAAFVVVAGSPGVERRHGVLIDGRPVAALELDDVAVPARARVADERSIEDAKRLGALAAAVSMSGGLRRALDLTVEYLKVREQFGVPIGAFQALQHRAAHLWSVAQLAAGIVDRALDAQDAEDPRAARFAHASKAFVSDAYLKVAEEGVQMHGGIGMTDEAEIGFHLKAARVAEQTHGDARTHRRRYAALSGY